MFLIRKILLFIGSTTDFGLREYSCEEFFDEGNVWPNLVSDSSAIRLCQGLDSNGPKYATLCK